MNTTIVDIIRPGSLVKTIGPSGTLKRIIKHKEYFLSRGYDINVFTHDSLRSISSNSNLNKNYKETKILKFKYKLRRISNDILILTIFYLLKDYLHIKKLLKYYKGLNRKADYIVFHSYLECYIYKKLFKNNKSKIIMFLHNDGIPFNMEFQTMKCVKGTYIEKALFKIFNSTLEYVDRITFITHIAEQNFNKYYNYKYKNKVCVILNGIDDFTTKQRDEHLILSKKNNKAKYRLISVGSINYRKGHQIILDAFSICPKEVQSQFTITIVGDGPQRAELEQYAKANNISQYLHFTGTVLNEDVYQYLATNNIFILMSKNEGLPISIIEAMRSELAIISTDVSGIPELVNDSNGILIKPSAKELNHIFTNMDKYDWNSMAKYSRIRFEKEFTFNRMMREYCDMLDSLNL